VRGADKTFSSIPNVDLGTSSFDQTRPRYGHNPIRCALHSRQSDRSPLELARHRIVT
jgi:hypothetical protein